MTFDASRCGPDRVTFPPRDADRGATGRTRLSATSALSHYLAKTGVPHPMAEEVIRSQENDWRKVSPG